MSNIAACPPSLFLMILQLCHLPPPFPPPVSDSSPCSLNASPCMPAAVLYYWTFWGTVRFKYFNFCVCFLHIICVKSVINLLQYSTIQLIGYLVGFVRFTNKFDLQMWFWNETHLYRGDILYPLFTFLVLVHELGLSVFCTKAVARGLILDLFLIFAGNLWVYIFCRRFLANWGSSSSFWFTENFYHE